MAEPKPMPNPDHRPPNDGDRYVPYGERAGNESIVYFTRDLSAEGLKNAYAQVNGTIGGNVAVKLHTGEPHGPNIIPHEWVQSLMEEYLPDATIVETNTYYEGGRYTTEEHRKTLETNGWTFCPVDIMDAEGTALLPTEVGNWFEEMSVGRDLLNYDTLVALTHFKGHDAGGFGGSNKNIGIGCADGRDGKRWIHTVAGSDDMWSIVEEELMERMTESSRSVLNFFGDGITYVNVLRNMSVDCDCAGVDAAPVETPNIGILASTDMLAIDQASVDLVHALSAEDGGALQERIRSRHGHHQLAYMEEMGMGNRRYVLVDLDNGGARITAEDAVADVVPFEG